MTFDDTTDLPTEQHQAPADVPRADTTVLLGTGIEVDGHMFTEAKIKIVGGMSEFAIPNPPRRGQCRTYVVKTQCTRYIIDEKAEEPRLILEVEHYVVYDREQGPLNDRQCVESPAELEALERKAKEVADADTPDVDENQPALFGEAPDDEGDLPSGPEWGDDGPRVSGEPTKAFAGGPQFSGEGDGTDG